MRFRLFLLTLVTLFLVTVLAIPWFISLSKLELDDSRPVLSVFPLTEDPPAVDARELLRQRADVEDLIPLEHVALSTPDGSLELQAQPFRPKVVSISTKSKNIMDGQLAVLLPRVVNGKSLSHLDGASIELDVVPYRDEAVEPKPIRVVATVAGVFDQGWSALAPEVGLVSAELIDALPQDRPVTELSWFVTLAPQADGAAVISLLNESGFHVYEEFAPVWLSLTHRIVPWLGFAAAFFYAIILAQQTKRVASSGVLTLLSSRLRFMGNCLLQSLLGSLFGVGLGLGLGSIVSSLTFLKDLSIEPEVWTQSIVVIGAVVVGTLIVVAVMAAGLWRAAQQTNSLAHFRELFT